MKIRLVNGSSYLHLFGALVLLVGYSFNQVIVVGIMSLIGFIMFFIYAHEYFELDNDKIIHRKNFYTKKVEEFKIVELKQINRYKEMRAIFLINTRIHFTFKDGKYFYFDEELVDRKKLKVFIEEVLRQSKLQIVQGKDGLN